MKFGSLFTGIGGFDLGLERAGLECAWQVENDSQCVSVLRRRWPDIPKFGDIATLKGEDLEPVELVCGGFPCQDLSVAGRRAGLAGKRSGLFHEFMRIVAEIAPRWVLIENVAGLLSSSGGRDMGTVLGVLGQLGYGWSYRVLDSQYFGVPQRRRRVFIVGCSGGVCPPEVLFEPESLPGDSPPSREAGARVAASLTRGTESAGRGGYAGRRQEDDVNLFVNALQASNGGPDDNRAQAGHVVADEGTFASETGHGWWTDDGLARLRVSAAPTQPQNIVAHALTASPTATGRLDPDGQTFVIEKEPSTAHALTAEGHDASEDGTGRGVPLVAQAFNWQSGGDCRGLNPQETTNALHVGQVPAVAFNLNQRREGRVGPTTDALHGPSGTQLTGVLEPPLFALQGAGKTSQGSQGSGFKQDSGFTLNLVDVHGVAGGNLTIPRRLTPTECERLQAFPDGWTAEGVDEAGAPVKLADSPRYRMLGNAVTVNVAEWIGRRITEAAA